MPEFILGSSPRSRGSIQYVGDSADSLVSPNVWAECDFESGKRHPVAQKSERYDIGSYRRVKNSIFGVCEWGLCRETATKTAKA